MKDGGGGEGVIVVLFVIIQSFNYHWKAYGLRNVMISFVKSEDNKLS